jgi:hypothetical protein
MTVWEKEFEYAFPEFVSNFDGSFKELIINISTTKLSKIVKNCCSFLDV